MKTEETKLILKVYEERDFDCVIFVYPIFLENGKTEWAAEYPSLPYLVGGGDSPEEAVKEAQKKIAAKNRAIPSHSGCPGSKIMQIRRTETSEPVKATSAADSESKLQNWPVQIKLAPVNAPYFNGSKLLIAADCTAYAYAAFHQDFIRNKVTLIGCPKLDQVDYSEKLTAIIQNNNIQSVTIVRMEVRCCGGLEIAVIKALQASGKFIPWQVVTISIDGKIME